eukprot:3266626-Pleurochrysis_carterae.AAC.3
MRRTLTACVHALPRHALSTRVVPCTVFTAPMAVLPTVFFIPVPEHDPTPMPSSPPNPLPSPLPLALPHAPPPPLPPPPPHAPPPSSASVSTSTARVLPPLITWFVTTTAAPCFRAKYLSIAACAAYVPAPQSSRPPRAAQDGEAATPPAVSPPTGSNHPTARAAPLARAQPKPRRKGQQGRMAPGAPAATEGAFSAGSSSQYRCTPLPRPAGSQQ